VKSGSQARVPGLDSLRALAILLVMTFHLKSLLPNGFALVGRFGWMGVDLFFALSGYLIGSQLFKNLRHGEPRDWRSVVLISVTCLVIAALMHLGIERPFLALRDRRSARRDLVNSMEVAEPAI
jgi:peptidoglycan/LPS O-acetylase OafA/YrhL